MEVPWASLQGFAGSAGVGSLVLLGVFLIVDSLHEDVFPTIEIYSKTATWGIVAAIPILAIAYVLGLLFIGVGELLLDAFPIAQTSDKFADLLKVSVLGKEPITERYQQLYQESHVLAGSALAFVLLSVGGACDARNLPSLRYLIYGGALGGVLAAALIFALAISKSRVAHALVLTL